MADYVYRISASGTATGANAGFTTIAAAITDFKTTDRMGAGAGVVAASSTLYFKIDGFLSLTSCDLYGFNVSASGAAIVVEGWLGPFNAIVRALGYTTGFDGIDFGPSAQMNAGLNANRQAKLTVRNLVITSSAGALGTVEAFGPTDGSSNVQLVGCVIRNSHSGSAVGVKIDATDLINCTVITPNGSGATMLVNYGRTGGNNIDQCTMVALGGTPATWFVYNQNDPPPKVRNTYVGNVTGLLGGGGTWPGGSTGNATSLASGWVSGTLYSVALDTTNFTNVTSGSEDLRVKSASVLATTGATRLASVLADVFGTSRADPATIGAYEYAAPASVLTGGVTLDDIVASGSGTSASSSITGTIALDDLVASGSGSSVASSLTGSITLADVVGSGSAGPTLRTVVTLPFSRNTGTRPTGLSSVAVAVLSDDTSLTRLDGSTGISQSVDGSLSFSGYSLPASGTYVVVLTREPDGKLGVERYQVQ